MKILRKNPLEKVYIYKSTMFKTYIFGKKEILDATQ